MNGPCGRIKKVYHYVNRGVVVVPIMLTMDKATVDGNGRKSPIPVFISFLCIRAHTRHKPWARQLLGYVSKFNKGLWPKYGSDGEVLPDNSKQQFKRQVRQLALKKMLHELEKLGETGVAMELPGLDGQWRMCTVVPMLFYVCADYKTAQKFTNTEDKYTCMPMFCWQCVIFKSPLSIYIALYDLYHHAVFAI